MKIKSKSRPCRSVSSQIERCERRLLMSTYTVNTLSDAVNPGVGLLTLRQAVADTNAHPGNDTIAFSPAVFPAGSLHTITLGRGEVDFTDTSGTTTLKGPGAAVLDVNGGGKSRVFGIGPAATVHLSGVEITGGNATVADASGNTYGGGVYDAGKLTIDQSVVSGNTVTATGTGPGNDAPPGVGYGGGVYAAGALTITNSTLSGNSISNTAQSTGESSGTGGIKNVAGNAEGAAVYCGGALVLTADTISNNTATGETGNSSGSSDGGAFGGGVYGAGSVTVSACTVTGNIAQGGASDTGFYWGNPSALGGGIFGEGAVTISGSVVANNSAFAGETGGDFGQGGGLGEGGGVYAGSTLTMTHSTVSGNQASAQNAYGTSYGSFDAGGGAYSVGNTTISQTIISGNHVTGGDPKYGDSGIFAAGGGVFVGGVLSLSQCTISGNSESCLYPSYGVESPASVGGGVDAAGGGTILGSTIAGNSATGGAGYNGGGFDSQPGGNGQGGGVYASAPLTITNSTIVANAVTGGVGGMAFDGQPGQTGGTAEGGGVYATAPITLADCTITGNTTTGGTGGAANDGYAKGATGTSTGAGIFTSGPAAILTNIIISGDQSDQTFNDITGELAPASANNLIGVGGGLTNGVNGNIVGVNNPKLSPLGNNGGPTPTMVPLPGSPVIDKGSNSLIPAGVTTDQRGFPRIAGASVDIGATENGTAAIIGLVFNDRYATGKRDHADDEGLAGWTVYLDLNHNGQFDSGDISTTTATNGNYAFYGLPAGTYTVAVVGEKNFRASSPDPVTITAKSNTVTSGPLFAETGDALLLGSVIDTATKKGLAGWRVYIDLNNSGKYVPTDPNVVTASNGSWSLNTPLIGTYTVRVVPETGYTLASPASTDFIVSIGKGSIRSNNVFGETKIS